MMKIRKLNILIILIFLGTCLNPLTFSENTDKIITSTLQPTIDITYPDDGAEITEQYIVVEGYAYDEMGLDYYQWTWEWSGGSQSGDQEIYPPVEYYEFQIDIGPLSVDENTVTVTFYNTEGLSGSDSVTFYYVIDDTEPPELVITSPEDGEEFEEPEISVFGYADDHKGSGIIKLFWTHIWDGGSEDNAEYFDTPQDIITFEIPIILNPGENTIIVNAEDDVGNYLINPPSITVTLTTEEGLLLEALFQPVQTVYPDDPQYGNDISGGPCKFDCKLDMIQLKNTYLFGYPYNTRDHIDIKVHNNYKSERTFTFVFKITPDNKVVWRSDPVTMKPGEKKTFTYKTPIPEKPFKWGIWDGKDKQKPGSVILCIEPNYAKPPADYRCTKVIMNLTVKRTHDLYVLFIPFTFKDGPTMHQNFTTVSGRENFSKYLFEEFEPWWNAIYPLREIGLHLSYHREHNMIQNLSIINTSTIPYHKVWIHDLASYQALNTSERNQLHAQFGRLSALQKGLHKDIAKDVKYYDRVVFLLPREVVEDADGLAYKCGPNDNEKHGVMVSWTARSGKPLRDHTAAHEIGHTYGLADNYDWSKHYWGDPAVGYWVNKKIDVPLNPNVIRDLMSYTNAIWGTTNKTWIEKPNFKALTKRFNEHRDPEVVLVNGFIDSNDNVYLSHWYHMNESLVDIEWGISGEYLIRGFDFQGNLLGETGFNINLERSKDYTNNEMIDFTFFGFRLEQLPGLERIDITKASTNIKLASRSKTSNTPSVDFIKPMSGEKIKPGDYSISWNGNDDDGDVLEYNVYLIKEDGENWSSLGLAMSEESIIADFSELDPGNYQLAIVVSDGWNTAGDIVDFKIKKGREKTLPFQNIIIFKKIIELFPFLNNLLKFFIND